MKKKTLTQKEKNKTLYKAAVQAFFLNEIESDKILLGVSSGGIGLLATVLLNYQQVYWLLTLLAIISFISFGITIIFVIKIFKLNKKQVLQIMKDNGVAKTYPLFDTLEKCKNNSFLVAICSFSLFFILNLIIVGYNKNKYILNGEQKMKEKEKTEQLRNEKREDGFSFSELENNQSDKNSNEQKNQNSDNTKKEK